MSREESKLRQITLSIDLAELEARVSEVHTMAIHLNELFKEFKTFEDGMEKKIESVIESYMHRIFDSYRSEVKSFNYDFRKLIIHTREVSEELASKTIQLLELKNQIKNLKLEKQLLKPGKRHKRTKRG